MAIEGDTLEEAARRFREHLNGLLARTVTRTRLVSLPRRGARRPSSVQIAFRQGGAAIEAPILTRFGRVGLYLGQRCESIEQSGRHRLRTASYRYALTPQGAREPLLRWEYVRDRGDPDARWCRHHLQGDVPLPFGGGVSLNALHLPTGYVTVEEVLRFCIVDLGVPPLATDWSEQLEASYVLFKGDFTS